MKPIDTGCYPESEVHFYTPGDQARRTFFYPLCAGHYYCDSTYQVQRSSYDSYLLMYIKKGAGHLTSPNATGSFHAGDLVTVDCYQPHSYSTTKDSEILWVHFDGASSREYVEAVKSDGSLICSLKDGMTAEKLLLNIINAIRSQEHRNDALCSCCIVRLLTEALLSKKDNQAYPPSAHVIEDTVSYISRHICEELPLKLLADRAGLSPFYFNRLFKKETGYTPHNYIIHSRIHIAKFYLKSSSYSVKEICFHSGFPTESSFCTTFKKICGMTPGEYRAEKEH